MPKKVGVILSGCGHLDGSEISEAVLALTALDRLGVDVVIAAPLKNQHHVIDHRDGSELEQERNILMEASRIARGKIIPLGELCSDELDALVLPGGFGVAKNLSSFAFEGPNGKLDKDFQKILETIFEQRKPIGAICISPAVICLALGKEKIEVTIGNDLAVSEAIESLGAKHIICEGDAIHWDRAHKIVTTPAYMYGDARLSSVALGIEKCMAKVVELIGQK